MTATNYEDGQVILIDKPLHWTSFDVVKKLRNLLKVKKIGHAGTLDPLATGLLILCTGKFTKKIEEFQSQQKEYAATFTLGKTTPSYDLETEFDSEQPYLDVSISEIQKAISQLTGEISQVPPIYSAIKKDGERAYNKARKNKTVTLDPRTVHVYQFEIKDIALPDVKVRISCSKGTYIRSLAHDFGQLVGVGAHLSQLRRTAIGEFSVNHAHTMQHFISQAQSA